MGELQGFVQNILHGQIGTTELLQSYVGRGSSEDDDEPEVPEKAKVPSRPIGIGASSVPPLLGSLLSSGGRDIYSPIRKDSSNDNETERQQMLAEQINVTGHKKVQISKTGKRGRKKGRPRKRRQPRCEELYTDKDRAAAVNMGSKDIKQSLSLKMKQDRSKALQIPEEAEPGTFLALGCYEMKNGDVSIARGFLSKALEMKEDDKDALLARSKCHIMLGDAKEALDDASNALRVDKNDIEAIYQKAEALYSSGQFEHSLMYYHRGLRIRPEMVKFRLGVQKAQKAIVNSIGPAIKLMSIGPDICVSKSDGNFRSQATTPITSRRSSDVNTNLVVKPPKIITKYKSATPSSILEKSSIASSKKQTNRYLGPLSADQLYLEKLLQDPHIKCLDKENKEVITKAEEALSYLRKRQTFWKQQLPPPTLKTKLKPILRLN